MSPCDDLKGRDAIDLALVMHTINPIPAMVNRETQKHKTIKGKEFIMSKKLTTRIMAILLALILCSSISINVFAVETNDSAITTDKSNDIYPNLDLSSYAVDKLPDGLRNSVLPDGALGKTISPLSADDLYSITINNGDGTNTLNVFQQPVKFIDENGAVRFRTNALEKVPGTGFLGLFKSEYAYQNEEGDVKTYFSDKIDKGVRLVYNEYEISMIPLTDSTKYPDISGLIGNESIGSGASVSSSVSIAKPYDNVIESKASFAQTGNKIEYRNVLTSGITYEYMPLANGIKENIILSEYKGINTFRFIIEMGSLVPETMAVRGDGIRLIDPSNPDKQEAMIISPVDAVDAVGRYSLDHAMYFTKTDVPGRYILTVIVDRDFLESKDTVYPVIIDPTISPNGTTNIADTFVSSNNPNVNYSTQTFMPVGMDVNYSESEAFLQFVGMERYRYIPPNNITEARLVMDCYSTNATSVNPLRLYVYDNSAQNTISSLTWNNKPSTYGSGYGLPNGDPASITYASLYQFTITNLVKNWFKSEVNEGGFSYKFSLRIKHYNPTGATHYATFRATEFMGSYPYFAITYTPSNPFTTSTMIQLKNRGSNKNLDASQSNDFCVVQYAADNRLNQWWKVIPLGSGVYKIENQWPYYQTQGRKFLSVSEFSNVVDLYSESSTLLTQRFYIIPCYDTSGNPQGYRIVSLYNVEGTGFNGNKAISNGGSTADGAAITYSTYSGLNNNQKWEIKQPYTMTVNNYYDHGYHVRYGESEATSRGKINSFTETISLRYMEIFGLYLVQNNATYFNSALDACKGTVTSCTTGIHADNECNETGCNIAKMCTHGTIHTDRDNVASNFHGSYMGNCSTVYALWTNHRIKSITGGNDFYNRSCAYPTLYTIFMLENSTAANRTRDSQGVFMHELNHTIGAPDHYHEQTALLDITTCLRCTSNGGNGLCSNALCNSWNGTTNRPSSCIMNDSRVNISSDSIICDGCKTDILSHLQNGSH